jgi:hypothetical protein
MNMWTAIMVIAIVAITSVARVKRAQYNAQAGIFHDNAGNQQVIARGADPEMQRELEDLRKRIAVLERIATDDRKSQSIAAEIESLRSK